MNDNFKTDVNAFFLTIHLYSTIEDEYHFIV